MLQTSQAHTLYMSDFSSKKKMRVIQSFISAECPFVSMEQNIPSAIPFNNDLHALLSRQLAM